MGGRAFIETLGIESKRLEANDYLALDITCRIVLENYFDKVHTIKAFNHKLDFGDIDILVAEPKQEITQELMKKELPQRLGAAAVQQNSKTYSYLIDGFQLDLILCNRNHFDSSSYYLDFDPSGNLGGKIMHRFGARLGNDGMSYILRDKNNTYKLGKIQISDDPKKICDFLNLNYKQRCAGFDTQKDIFEWIISSKYFDARIFSFENMNHIARVRDRKRASYRQFLEYIEKYKNRIYNWPLYKEDNLSYIDSYFPEANLIKIIEKLKADHARVCELSQKFNGTKVMEWLGIGGKELGAALGGYKATKPDWLCFLENSTEENIKIDFLAYYNSIIK